MASIFILIMVGLILIAASSAPAPASAAPQKTEPPSSEIKLPDGYIFFAPPPKPAVPPKKPKESGNNMVWNIFIGIGFILVLLSLLIVH